MYPVADENPSQGLPVLLVIEDDETIRTQLKWALGREYEVLLAGDRAEGLGFFLDRRPMVVILDLGLPPHPDAVSEGFAAMAEILETEPLAKIIISSGKSEREHAQNAIAEGAYDFFPKPVHPEELKLILRRAFHVSMLEREHRELQRQMAEKSFEDMLGASTGMQEVFATIRKVAGTDVPVLIMGENGTGKELAAQAIHRQSTRAAGPFVAINCGAIPETLLESELFGHEKGSFTGAHIQRRGRIETADGGTLFLDEIGEMPPALQVKLLRFLQEHVIERVGGREGISVNVRVIAATNMDIREAMRQGKFREDLFYRIGVVSITLPPLRERNDDIMLLATALLRRFTDEGRRRIIGFTQAAIRDIKRHTWPGNVRELENRIKRAVIMAEGNKITTGDLDLGTAQTGYEGRTLKEGREALEREMVDSALARYKGNVSKAAAELGISRPTLYELMEKLGIAEKAVDSK